MEQNVWKKSTCSGATNCVEIMDTGDGILMRDSKDPGTILRYTYAEWTAFTAGVHDGEFDL